MLNMTRLNDKGEDSKTGAAVLAYLMATEYYIGADGQAKSSSQYLGAGALALGLQGEVDIRAMEGLAAGISPDGQALRQNSGDSSRVGWDFTASAVKPFSIIVASVDQAAKDELMTTHHNAVGVMMDYLATKGQVRTGKAGMGERQSILGLVASRHTHWGSRDLDPQIHSHVLTYNCAQGEDGKWRALDTEVMKDHVRAAGALYRAQHAWELKQQGFGIIKDRELDADGRETGEVFFKIAGVSDELCEVFSKRRAAILEYQREHGGSAQQACLATRKHKDEPTYAELTKIWGESLDKIRVEEPKLMFESLESLKGLPDQLEQVSDNDILKHLHRHEAKFTMADVVERIAQENVGRMDAKGILLEADAFMLRNQIVQLDPPKRNRLDNVEPSFAAQWMIDMEQRIKSRAEARIDDASVRLDPKVVEQSIAKIDAKNGFAMSDEQRHMVHWAGCGTGGLCVIGGRAGAGKTTSIDAAVDAYKASGRNVLGVSTSWDAALKLQAATGIQSFSVEKLLFDLDNGNRLLTNKDVLIFDEGGMAGTEAIDRIQGHVDRVGGKLIIQGDARQIPPVVAGNPFVSLTQSVGAAHIDAIMRQKNLEDLASARMLYDERDRMGEKFMKRLEERGQLSVHETRKGAINTLAEHWVANTRKDQDKIVIGGTNNEVRLLNEAIRAKRRESGQLGEVEATFEAKAGGKWQRLTLAAGDRVRFSARDQELGTINGLQGVVVNVKQGREEGSYRLAVRSESEIKSKDGQLITFDTADFKSLTYGYAGTVHKSQGQSIPDVYHLANPNMTDRNMQLVAFTRMKERYMMYGSADDLADMGRRISTERPKLNAIDQLPKVKVQPRVEVINAELGRRLGAAVREEQMRLKGKAIRR